MARNKVPPGRGVEEATGAAGFSDVRDVEVKGVGEDTGDALQSDIGDSRGWGVREDVGAGNYDDRDAEGDIDEESESELDDEYPYPSGEEYAHTEVDDPELMNEENLVITEGRLANETRADIARDGLVVTSLDVDDDGWELDSEIDKDVAADSSDSGGCCGSVRTRKQPDPISDLGKIISEVDSNFQFQAGQLFRDVKLLREALLDYEVKGNYKLKRSKNDLRRLTVVCKGSTHEGGRCTWKLHAHKTYDHRIFLLKKIVNEHTCVTCPIGKPFLANCNWVAKKLKGDLMVDPNMSYELMENSMRKDWGVNLKRHTLYRARLKARSLSEGDHAKSYKHLIHYAEHLKMTILGSIMEFEFEDTPDGNEARMFKRVFVSFGAVIQGFIEGCRPFIGLDGCHLKGPYGGVLLAAVALDGDKGIYPVAFAIVDIECKSSWTFFLQHLKQCIGENWKGKQYSFMMDRQKGVVASVEECFPTAAIRYCGRHLYANFKNDLRSATALRDEFWTTVKAGNEYEFNRAIQKMLQLHREDAYVWLMREPVHRWARHAFSLDAKCEHITNNATESFNNWLGKIREMPIVKLIDAIREKMMMRISNRYSMGLSRQFRVTNKIRKRLDIIEDAANNQSFILAGVDEYEVTFKNKRYAVKLRERTCGCGWLSGLPCSHAAKCIISLGRSTEMYTDDFFTTQLYLDVYKKAMLHPMDTINLNPHANEEIILPPTLKRLPGRPRKNRRRAHSELNQHGSGRKRTGTVKCQNCGILGHNKRTCQRAPVKASRVVNPSCSGGEFDRDSGAGGESGGEFAGCRMGDLFRSSVIGRGMVRGRDQGTGSKGLGRAQGSSIFSSVEDYSLAISSQPETSSRRKQKSYIQSTQ